MLSVSLSTDAASSVQEAYNATSLGAIAMPLTTTSKMALFMLDPSFSPSLRMRVLRTGGSADFTKVKAFDFSLGLHSRMLSPRK